MLCGLLFIPGWVSSTGAHFLAVIPPDTPETPWNR